MEAIVLFRYLWTAKSPGNVPTRPATAFGEKGYPKPGQLLVTASSPHCCARTAHWHESKPWTLFQLAEFSPQAKVFPKAGVKQKLSLGFMDAVTADWGEERHSEWGQVQCGHRTLVLKTRCLSETRIAGCSMPVSWIARTWTVTTRNSGSPYLLNYTWPSGMTGRAQNEASQLEVLPSRRRSVRGPPTSVLSVWDVKYAFHSPTSSC